MTRNLPDLKVIALEWLRSLNRSDEASSLSPHVTVDASDLPSGAATEAKQDDIITQLTVINSLVPSVYDYVSLGYTGSNLTTVIFKSGGAGGSAVSTLTLAYTGSQLDSVTKT